jgi:hypothetical protein
VANRASPAFAAPLTAAPQHLSLPLHRRNSRTKTTIFNPSAKGFYKKELGFERRALFCAEGVEAPGHAEILKKLNITSIVEDVTLDFRSLFSYVKLNIKIPSAHD